MPAPVFLIGGGRDPEGVAASHAPFLAAAGGPVLCVVLEEPDVDLDRWRGALAGAEVRTLVVSPQRPPAVEDLDGVAAVYVAGGWTPGYADVLGGTAWAAAVRDRGLVYAGFSAGAAVAAADALVGGWRLGGVVVGDEDAGEDLHELGVRPGLALVPFAVDVHATEWGTLTRAAHAVAAGLVREALAVDEHTCVEVRPGLRPVLHGLGSAYRLGPGTLEVLRPG